MQVQLGQPQKFRERLKKSSKRFNLIKKVSCIQAAIGIALENTPQCNRRFEKPDKVFNN